MNILVTGANGFVGRHVLGALSGRGHKLGLLVRDVRKAAFVKTAEATLFQGDLDDVLAVRSALRTFRPEICVHLAWEGIPDYSAAVSMRNLDRSVAFTDFLVGEGRCRKVIVAGSAFEYGKDVGACSETDPVSTSSYIAWAKQSLYAYMELACRKASVGLVWLRLFYVYGPGQRPDSLIPTIVRAAARGEVPDVRTPSNANDFIFIGDAAEAFRLAAEREVESGIYNIGSGQATSVLEVCRMVAREVPGAAGFAEALASRSVPPDPACFWADIAKARRVLEWAPARSLPEGIRLYVASALREAAR